MKHKDRCRGNRAPLPNTFKAKLTGQASRRGSVNGGCGHVQELGVRSIPGGAKRENSYVLTERQVICTPEQPPMDLVPIYRVHRNTITAHFPTRDNNEKANQPQHQAQWQRTGKENIPLLAWDGLYSQDVWYAALLPDKLGSRHPCTIYRHPGGVRPRLVHVLPQAIHLS